MGASDSKPEDCTSGIFDLCNSRDGGSRQMSRTKVMSPSDSQCDSASLPSAFFGISGVAPCSFFLDKTCRPEMHSIVAGQDHKRSRWWSRFDCPFAREAFWKEAVHAGPTKRRCFGF